MEILRWSRFSPSVSPAFGQGAISGLWSLQALLLVGAGLYRQNRVWRFLGFLIFGLAVSKILFFDLQSLARVYRILSFTVTGLLLLIVSFLYHRFSSVLLTKGGSSSSEEAE
jgi:uncharacterized membrane protein